MSFTLQAMTSPCQDENAMFSIVAHLRDKGYNPLFTQARERFFSVFGESPPIESLVPFGQAGGRGVALDGRRRNHYGPYLGESEFVVAGDVLFSPEGTGILYVCLLTSDLVLVPRLRKQIGSPLRLDVGYFGDEKELGCLNDFAALVAEALSSLNESVEWSPLQPSNPQFLELASSEETEFVPADTISSEDIELSANLEDQATRDIALRVKRAGGMLAADLTKNFPNPDEAQRIVEQLVQAQLFVREYVVICRQTSKHINRVTSRDAIEKMAKAGVLCSCGRPISDERIEELLSPTPVLQRMLDQSYWTTARLVHTLRNLGISDNRMLLNLREGAEEMDAFADVDGTLLMFELKDKEFSMGHAYPFGGRIGLYEPHYAIIVSAKGIAPEVKDYFNRIEPEAEIVYVGHLGELSSSLREIIERVRYLRAEQVLSRLDTMAMVRALVWPILLSKIGFN